MSNHVSCDCGAVGFFHPDATHLDETRGYLHAVKLCAKVAALSSSPASSPAPDRMTCPLCKGEGERPFNSFSDPTKQIVRHCPECRGRGYFDGAGTEERVEVDAVIATSGPEAGDVWFVDSDDLADAGFRPGDRVRVTLVGPKTK